MKFSHLLTIIISASFVPLADIFVAAVLEQSPPGQAYIRFYDRPNCQVGYHETGLKDFYRLTCGPKLDGANCISGNFLSYRLEVHPGPDESLPKLDQLWVKTNSTTCDMRSNTPGDLRSFAPHPYSNPGFLKSGCNLFNPTNPLGIDPKQEISYTYWCTWGSYTPTLGGGFSGPQQPVIQPMINLVAPVQQLPDAAAAA